MLIRPLPQSKKFTEIKNTGARTHVKKHRRWNRRARLLIITTFMKDTLLSRKLTSCVTPGRPVVDRGTCVLYNACMLFMGVHAQTSSYSVFE